MPELSDLPNKLAGWGLAFLELKNKVGAYNMSIGMHISGWASGKDIFHNSAGVSLLPEVEKVYNFLAPLGLINNQTGITYDFLVGDPLDRDAGYYEVVQGRER